MRRYRPKRRLIFRCLQVKHDAPDDDMACPITHNVIIVGPYSAKALACFDSNKLISRSGHIASVTPALWAFSSYNLFMWGRVILGAVIVTLIILWLAALSFLLLDDGTFLQKWQRGLWNSANGVFDTRIQTPKMKSAMRLKGS